jgi:catechol 2,3-dioxygenase-like lactoylglutathione lyase family enzyme
VAPQAHVALRVAQLDELARRLTSAGHSIEPAPLPNGDERLYVEDPFGNRLELIEPAASSFDSTGGPRASHLQFSV